MPKVHASNAVACETCGKIISRKADLPRHMKTHAENKEELMHGCPHCSYMTLQKSNLLNHLNVHSGEKPYKCPEEGCPYSAAERGALTRHRQRRHGYQPKKKKDSSGDHEPMATRRRRRPRDTPSTTSSPTSGSSPTLDSSSPSSSLPPPGDFVEEGNATEFINNTRSAPNPPLEYALPRNSEFLTASEEPAAVHQHLPVPVQGELYAVDTTVQPVSQMCISEEVYDNFFSRFNDWETAGSSLSTPSVSSSVNLPPPPLATLPLYGEQYLIDNVPTPTTLPSYEDQYILDSSLIPTPAAPPPYAENTLVPATASDFSYGAESVNATYEYYNPTADAASFDATGTFSQPGSFVTPDMGVYPQAFYPQGVDQGSFYDTYAGTSGFAMGGSYVN